MNEGGTVTEAEASTALLVPKDLQKDRVEFLLEPISKPPNNLLN